MIRIILIVVLVATCLPCVRAGEAAKIASVEYWVDDNSEKVVSSTELVFAIDCSTLDPGLHLLHYRVADSDGRTTALHEHGFYKLPEVKTATKIESLQYWWDDAIGKSVTAPYSADSLMLATGEMSPGLHSIKYRVKDDAGRWSELRSHYFYKAAAMDSARIVSYRYWWNDCMDQAVVKTLDTPAVNFTFEENMEVPDWARTSFAGHYTATLNVAVTDSNGRNAFLQTDVAYPDNDAPVTGIDADKYATTSSVNVTWKETSGDKMGDYNVYYSRDNGPFVLWLADTKATKATFRGCSGSMYIFTVTGRDAYGNREEFDPKRCVSVTFE